MKKEAILVKKLSKRPFQNIYQLSQPINYPFYAENLKETIFVVSSYAITFDKGPEVMAFPANENGDIVSYSELYVSHVDFRLNSAIEYLGFEIVDEFSK